MASYYEAMVDMGETGSEFLHQIELVNPSSCVRHLNKLSPLRHPLQVETHILCSICGPKADCHRAGYCNCCMAHAARKEVPGLAQKKTALTATGSGPDLPQQCLGVHSRGPGRAAAGAAGVQRAQPAHRLLPEHELPGGCPAAGPGPGRGQRLLGPRLPHR